MRCSKCNSPIISGEEYCKICGTRIDKMPKVEKKEKKSVEVIDFEIDGKKQHEVEQVKETVSEQLDEINMIAKVDDSMNDTSYIIDHSSFDDEEKSEEVFGVTLTDLNMEPIVLGKTIKMPSISEEDIKAYENKEEPTEEKIEIEETKVEKQPEEVINFGEVEENKPEESQVEEERVTLDDLPIINEVEETKVDEKAEETVEKVEEPKTEVPKKTSTKEFFRDNKKVPTLKQNKNDLGIVIVAVLLVVSIILNIYLFVSTGNKESNKTGETSKITKTAKVMFKGYKMDISAGWITEYDSDNNTNLLYDNSSEWLASVQIIDEIDYDTLIENSEDFTKDMKELNYEFTSNYAKDYDKKSYYLFKGKNEDNTVYLIMSKIDRDTIATATVHFKDEVDDKLVKNIATTIGTIDENKGDENKSVIPSNTLSEICKKYGVKEEEKEEVDEK